MGLRPRPSSRSICSGCLRITTRCVLWLRRRDFTFSTTPPRALAPPTNAASSALSRLLVIVENYPQLKSNETFARLMDELSGTENRIAVERMRYNEAVQTYNTARRQVPANVTAKVFGFNEYKLFEAPPEAKVAPKVDFAR